MLLQGIVSDRCDRWVLSMHFVTLGLRTSQAALRLAWKGLIRKSGAFRRFVAGLFSRKEVSVFRHVRKEMRTEGRQTISCQDESGFRRHDGSRLVECKASRAKQNPGQQRYPLWRLGEPIPQRPKIPVTKRQPPNPLITINGIAQAQSCFLYAPCHTRAARKSKKN